MSRSASQAQRDKAELLRRLHHDSTILTVINVWDVASARTVATSTGCTAIATASAAITAAHGYDDDEHAPGDLAVATLERISRAVDLPVTADLERGYADIGATTSVALLAGAVGINLEDDMVATPTTEQHIEEAPETGRAHAISVVINARTDVYLARTDWTPRAATHRGSPQRPPLPRRRRRLRVRARLHHATITGAWPTTPAPSSNGKPTISSWLRSVAEEVRVPIAIR